MNDTPYERRKAAARQDLADFKEVGYKSVKEMRKQVNDPAYPKHVRESARGYLSQWG